MNKDTIVTFCSEKYLHKLDKLLTDLNNLQINNYQVVAMDEATYYHLDGDRVVLMKLPHLTKSNIWIERMKFMSKLISNNTNCLHLDVDSRLKHSPFEYFSKHPDVDMFLGQGSVHPQNIYNKQKFVVRGGTHFTRANTHTKRMWEQLSSLTQQHGDDQTAMNVMFSEGAVWSDVTKIDQYDLCYTDKHYHFNYSGFKQPVYGMFNNIKLMLLPHHLFSRYRTNDDYIQCHFEG